MNEAILRKLPSIPQYFKDYVDANIDLDETSSIPCPFHKEVVGKSFSYSKTLGIWRCFGACHTGGDVVAMHQKNYGLKSREEALKSICAMYNVEYKMEPVFEKKEIQVDMVQVHRSRALAAAMNLAHTTDDYLELDYIVSKVPYDVKELEMFCSVRGFHISTLEEQT